jgi:Putative peptidoglycan binding domain
VPRSIAVNDRTASRRRKAAAAETERGLLMQLMFHSPKDTLAGAVALTAALAIIVNALFLQAGRHPSPLFATVLPATKNVSEPQAAPRPATVIVTPAQQTTASPQATSSPMPRPRPAEAEMRPGDPLGNLVRSTSAPSAPAATAPVATAPRPPATIPQSAAPAKADPAAGTTLSSARVAAVQRALTDYGYGQIKATGTVGADTQAAIQKFERERKLPLTGQVSERLVRELGLATGRTFE